MIVSGKLPRHGGRFLITQMIFLFFWGLPVLILLFPAGGTSWWGDESGNKIAFLAYHDGSIPFLTAFTRLYAVDLDDNSVTLIETPNSMKFYVEEAEWSPDGRWIAFTKIEDDPSTQQPTDRIYVTDRLGRKTFLIANDGYHLSWSPGSDKIVYNIFENGRYFF